MPRAECESFHQVPPPMEPVENNRTFQNHTILSANNTNKPSNARDLNRGRLPHLNEVAPFFSKSVEDRLVTKGEISLQSGTSRGMGCRVQGEMIDSQEVFPENDCQDLHPCVSLLWHWSLISATLGFFGFWHLLVPFLLPETLSL